MLSEPDMDREGLCTDFNSQLSFRALHVTPVDSTMTELNNFSAFIHFCSRA